MNARFALVSTEELESLLWGLPPKEAGQEFFDEVREELARRIKERVQSPVLEVEQLEER
jgi:hypothetical protein